jgi:hypothetical protein
MEHINTSKKWVIATLERCKCGYMTEFHYIDGLKEIPMKKRVKIVESWISNGRILYYGLNIPSQTVNLMQIYQCKKGLTFSFYMDHNEPALESHTCRGCEHFYHEKDLESIFI